MFREPNVELLARIEVRLTEVLVRPKAQVARIVESNKAGIVAVGLRVERLRKEVLLEVMRQLLFVCQPAVAPIEAFRQQQKPTDSVAVLTEVLFVSELLCMPLELVSPDVLYVMTVPARRRVLGKPTG